MEQTLKSFNIVLNRAILNLQGCIIINKNDKQNVIINSVKGLSILTPNINNIPFQICWKKNQHFSYDKIKNKIKMFIECLQRPKPSWKEHFMTNIRLIQL